MQYYSPFRKPLLDLQPQDLGELRYASEGWYIEYKEQAPNAAALAKAISAFANTYGGWLFLGIREESKENPVAGSFLGLPEDMVDSVLQRMRKSAADHLNPTPYFETKVFWGPCLEIGLSEKHAVICAWVPRSSSAPHVHKEGKIYRRVADASEPKPENDRFVLDQLWHRADEIKQYHKDWYEQDPEFSEQEKNLPYVRLMLVADRWLERDIVIDADDDTVRSLFSKNLDGGTTIPFDTVYTTADGFIARQLKNNDPQHLLLTWRLRFNLESDVIIPLPAYEISSIDQLEFFLKGYAHESLFVELLNQYSFNSLRIVDLNHFFAVLSGVAWIQEQLCKLARWPESYSYKIKLLNSWRTVPYIDSTKIIKRFHEIGLPMCMDSVTSFPYGTDPDSYSDVPLLKDIKSPKEKYWFQAAIMFFSIQKLYGIPGDDKNDLISYFNELGEAGRRAVDVQRIRTGKMLNYK